MLLSWTALHSTLTESKPKKKQLSAAQIPLSNSKMVLVIVMCTSDPAPLLIHTHDRKSKSCWAGDTTFSHQSLWCRWNRGRLTAPPEGYQSCCQILESCSPPQTPTLWKCVWKNRGQEVAVKQSIRSTNHSTKNQDTCAIPVKTCVQFYICICSARCKI